MIDAALNRLREFHALDDSEVAALAAARQAQLKFDRRQAITEQGDPVSAVYLLLEGWAGTSMENTLGKRQMLDVHLPGDILGLPSMALTHAAETVTALTAVVVDVIPVRAFARLFENAPRLALTLFLVSQQDRVMLMDHLTAVGHMNAMQRVCGLLLHVHRRLTALNPAAGCLIDWPLSQRHIAEGGGLTTIHVNRTFRELERKGLIERKGRRIKLLDVHRLRELAGLPERDLARAPDWLTTLRCNALEASGSRQ